VRIILDELLEGSTGGREFVSPQKRDQQPSDWGGHVLHRRVWSNSSGIKVFLLIPMQTRSNFPQISAQIYWSARF